MLPEKCINFPITFNSASNSQKVKDILSFLEMYNLDYNNEIVTFETLSVYMRELCPLGTYFGEDEYGAIGYWEAYAPENYQQELEEFYERF